MNDKRVVGLVVGAGIGIALLWWLLKAQAAPPPEGGAEVTDFVIKKG